MAIETYSCAATLTTAVLLKNLHTEQAGSSREILEKLSALQHDLDFKTGEIKTFSENMSKQAERFEGIREEFAAFRSQESITETLEDQRPSAGPAPDLGTMADYLRAIWSTGSTTTSDQDIWECYYDIISVYIRHEFPVSIRFGFSVAAALRGTSEREGLLRIKPLSSRLM